ncbi:MULTISPECIES: phage Gp37/Gp68 family protein [unclassified Mesorhizobium]|uniref:DUF5131 family protein n=1 Tax=unclassified Mesorhizobium TaxID=325217 RepID=UPI00112B7B91|nr:MULTISPECIES: phage Gp37/Gp68 family protein [unclassified Mesorhizobium]MCA0027383.1 phage Gp37/Gp68 family protein [Mesorhizobium sp. B263B1A]TPJ98653.1 phage Gp37/Gp68 family protein [Mesorhizobium sp. B2-5-12]TPK28816.1 phage Gp37/Gp68 family protein [Mesorhizobium sp. B2-5-6]
MADHSSIEWTDATWNPITGCSVVSPGCTNCYAMKLAGTRLKHIDSRKGLTRDTKAGPVWTGEVRLNRQWLHQPFDWKKPRRIFVCAHGDLFAENVPDEWILDVFTVMAAARHHTYQVLTKRADRMREFLSRRDLLEEIYANWYNFTGQAREVYSWPLHNVWCGVSAEDQKRADERVPDLLATPAKIRFVSAEPLLGPIDFRQWQHDYGCGCGWGGDFPLDYCTNCGWRGDAHGEIGDAVCPECKTALADYNACPECDGHDGDGMSFGPNSRPRLDWIIVGGESGRAARPMHSDWARSIRDQCQAANVPFFFKQWGAWSPLARSAPVLEAEGSTASVAWPDGTIGAGSAATRNGAGTSLYRATKAIAGRQIDGVEHNAIPEVPA